MERFKPVEMEQPVSLNIEFHLQKSFPELKALTCQIMGVGVEKRKVELESFKEEVMKQVREQYDLESLRNLST
ncbi:MAG: hypothetical protein OEX99_04410, partial [Candidatus Bathyarchaeota archaeon]|nr:hypothetical protein [Candidatus Bathyarchaeota archaeon]